MHALQKNQQKNLKDILENCLGRYKVKRPICNWAGQGWCPKPWRATASCRRLEKILFPFSAQGLHYNLAHHSGTACLQWPGPTLTCIQTLASPHAGITLFLKSIRTFFKLKYQKGDLCGQGAYGGKLQSSHRIRLSVEGFLPSQLLHRKGVL